MSQSERCCYMQRYLATQKGTKVRLLAFPMWVNWDIERLCGLLKTSETAIWKCFTAIFISLEKYSNHLDITCFLLILFKKKKWDKVKLRYPKEPWFYTLAQGPLFQPPEYWDVGLCFCARLIVALFNKLKCFYIPWQAHLKSRDAILGSAILLLWTVPKLWMPLDLLTQCQDT